MRPKFPTVAFVSKEQVRDGIGVGSLGDLRCLVGGHHVDGRRTDDAHLAVGSTIEDHLEEDCDVPGGGEQAVTAHNAAHYPVEVILNHTANSSCPQIPGARASRGNLRDREAVIKRIICCAIHPQLRPHMRLRELLQVLTSSCLKGMTEKTIGEV